MSNSGDAAGGVQSVDRALTILAILARLGQAGVTEIAVELGVHKSTAFRLVSTLEAHELVEQTEERGKYRLGLGLVRLAGASTARLDVVQEARPVCRRLAAESGETVNVAVLSDRRGALRRPGGRRVEPAVAQLGRPAHPAARHLQRQGAAQRAGDRPRSTGGVDRAPGLHRPHDHRPATLLARARPGPGAGLRRRRRRARGGADGARGAGAQRPRRRGRLGQRLRADLPAARRAGRRAGRRSSSRPPTRCRADSGGSGDLRTSLDADLRPRVTMLLRRTHVVAGCATAAEGVT